MVDGQGLIHGWRDILEHLNICFLDPRAESRGPTGRAVKNTFFDPRRGAENTLTLFVHEGPRRGTENTLTPFCPRRTRRGTENTLTPFLSAEDAEGHGEHLNTFLSAEDAEGHGEHLGHRRLWS